ncbi:MAG: IS4 family transposase, partial [Microcystaceae cyanobacterium]
MNQINLLKETLKPLLGWHGARLNFLALFLIALLRVKTVNLAELATGFRNNSQSESNYKRMQRFFRKFDLDYAVIAKIVVALMGIPQPWVLSLDRTNWSYGQTHFNILTLGIVHQGIAYPVVWQMLEKKGNSNTEERVEILEAFFKIFPDAKVAHLCTDREFVGCLWLSYLLLDPMLCFRARIRKSDKISDGKKLLSASVIFSHLKPGESLILSGRRWVWGRSVYVGGLRLDDGDLLVIISPDFPQTMISDYAQRWGIETLFGMFKTRGFCLESTHFVDSQRLSKLLALMTLSLCWAVKMG